MQRPLGLLLVFLVAAGAFAALALREPPDPAPGPARPAESSYLSVARGGRSANEARADARRDAFEVVRAQLMSADSGARKQALARLAGMGQPAVVILSEALANPPRLAAGGAELPAYLDTLLRVGDSGGAPVDLLPALPAVRQAVRRHRVGRDRLQRIEEQLGLR